MSNGELDQYFSTSPDEEVIKAAPGSHNELNDETLQVNNDNNDAELQGCFGYLKIPLWYHVPRHNFRSSSSKYHTRVPGW